jgi:hypothetical protein
MALERPSIHPYWWLAPTYNQVLAGLRLVEWLGKSSGVLRSLVMTPYPIVKLSSGGKLEFRSWEREQNLMGTSIAGGVVDEAGLLTPEAQAAISTRRSSTLGPLRYIGNPGLTAGPFRRLCSLAEAPDHDPAIFSIHKWTWQDKAASLSDGPRRQYEAFIHQERLSLPEFEFRRLYNAEWTEDESAVFRGLDGVLQHGDSELLAPDADQFVIGVDVAQTTDFLVACSMALNSRRIELRERMRGVSYPQAAVRLKDLQDMLGGALLVVESNGPGIALIQELDRLECSYWPVTTTNQSKQEYVLGLAADIQNKRVTIADISPLPYELALFRYERLLSGYRYGAPNGEHDDCVIAACLARHGAVYAGGSVIA